MIGYHSITNIGKFSKSKLKMKSLLLFLILTFTLGQLSIVVESKRCGKNENTLTLEVRAEFYQKPLLSAFKYTKVIKASKSFKKTLTQMATSASVSGSYGAFSASASASYSSLKDSVISSEEYGMKEKKEETKYNPDFLQIFRKVETRLTVNEYTGSITEERIVDSKPKAEKYSSAELRKEAADYMAWEFGKEKVVKNKFTETVCTKIIENSEIFSKKETRKYQIWTDSGSGAWRDFSCWNPRGDSMLASIPENGYDGNFKGYVFTGANGVLDKPRDYKLVIFLYVEWAQKHLFQKQHLRLEIPFRTST